MKPVVTLAALCVVSLATVGSAEERTAPFDWIETYEEALSLTRTDERPLLLYFPPRPPKHQQEPRKFNDDRVAALLRGFNCVRVGDDASTELRNRFSVRWVNPTYIALNGEEENIHRWSGGMPAESFAKQLEEALDRYDLYLAGEAWDTMAIADRDDLKSIEAPEDDRIRGLAVADGRLWVLHRSNWLYAIDPTHGDVLERVEFPPVPVISMTGAGKHLYLASICWTKGDPVYRIDVRTQEIDKKIVTRKNRSRDGCSARGIAAHADRLYITHEWTTVSTLDVESGDELHRFRVTWEDGLILSVSGIGHDGQHLYGRVTARASVQRGAPPDFDAPTISGVATIDAETGEVLDLLTLGFPFVTFALHDGAFVIGDHVREDFDRQHRWRRVYPPDHVRISFAYP